MVVLACSIISLDETRSNPAVPGAIMGITASSAALVVAHQQADFALTTDHLAGARVSSVFTAMQLPIVHIQLNSALMQLSDIFNICTACPQYVLPVSVLPVLGLALKWDFCSYDTSGCYVPSSDVAAWSLHVQQSFAVILDYTLPVCRDSPL